MSIWVSIQGTDPVTYETGDGDDFVVEGWFDVAVSSFTDDRFRIIVQDEFNSADIVLDSHGLAELHRRIVVARDRAKK